MINNAVQNGYGRVIGFRCFECGGCFESMWGEICNSCREKERRHQETLAVLRALQSAEQHSEDSRK